MLAHPCVHRDPEFGTRVPHRVGELSPEDCADLFQCVEVWFQQHGAQLPPPPTPLFRVDPDTRDILAHVCDSSCPWLIHNTVYYCCWSGAYHNCTTEACEYTDAVPATAAAVKTKGARLYHMEQVALPVRDKRACRITGQVFDLAFGLSFEQAGFQQSDYKRSTRSKEAPATQHSAHKWMRRHGAGGDALCIMSSPEPSPTPSPPPPPARPALPSVPFQLTTTKSREEDLLIFAGYINHFLVAPGFDIDACRDLAAEILNTGEIMKQTASSLVPGFVFPASYTPLAHVMTLLTCMESGAEVAYGRTFLPFRVELVGRLLPLRERIRATGKRNQFKTHTEWNTLVGTLKRAYCRAPPPPPLAPLYAPLQMLQLRPRREAEEDRGRLLSASTLAALLQADSQPQWPLLPH